MYQECRENIRKGQILHGVFQGLVLRVMRHQGGVYIGTAYDNIVMFAPFRAVVHPCQYTRRGDQVEFNIPANYVPPKVCPTYVANSGALKYSIFRLSLLKSKSSLACRFFVFVSEYSARLVFRNLNRYLHV